MLAVRCEVGKLLYILTCVYIQNELWRDWSMTEIIVFVCFLTFKNKTLPIENTTDCLSTMASVCKVMLETP